MNTAKTTEPSFLAKLSSQMENTTSLKMISLHGDDHLYSYLYLEDKMTKEQNFLGQARMYSFGENLFSLGAVAARSGCGELLFNALGKQCGQLGISFTSARDGDSRGQVIAHFDRLMSLGDSAGTVKSVELDDYDCDGILESAPREEVESECRAYSIDTDAAFDTCSLVLSDPECEAWLAVDSKWGDFFDIAYGNDSGITDEVEPLTLCIDESIRDVLSIAPANKLKNKMVLK